MPPDTSLALDPAAVVAGPAPVRAAAARPAPVGAAAHQALPKAALPGDFAIWVFIFAELLVFGVLFVVYAFARRANVELFNTEQALLDRRLGLASTGVLLTGSYVVALAVEAIRAGRSRACAHWLFAALALGGVFVAIKITEFRHDTAAGMNLSRNLFEMFYLSLTGFHFLHVLMGMVILAVVAVKAWHGGYDARSHAGVETAGSYWHMVDLVWILLFVLVYVLH